MLYVKPCMRGRGKKKKKKNWIFPRIKNRKKWKRVPAAQGLGPSESENIQYMKTSKNINKATIQ